MIITSDHIKVYISTFNKLIFSVDSNDEINFTDLIIFHKYFESIVHINCLNTSA